MESIAHEGVLPCIEEENDEQIENNEIYSTQLTIAKIKERLENVKNALSYKISPRSNGNILGMFKNLLSSNCFKSIFSQEEIDKLNNASHSIKALNITELKLLDYDLNIRLNDIIEKLGDTPIIGERLKIDISHIDFLQEMKDDVEIVLSSKLTEEKRHFSHNTR